MRTLSITLLLVAAPAVAFAGSAHGKRQMGGGFIEFVANGGAMAPRAPAYVVDMGQPGVKGIMPLPDGYVAPYPRARRRAPGYVVDMGQPGIRGVGALPRGYIAPVPRYRASPGYRVDMGTPGYGLAPEPDYGDPLPPPRRAYAAYGQPYADPADVAPAPRRAGGFDPRYARQVVSYDRGHKPGTIVIDTSERFLYLVQADGRALRYGVGVGREGFEWKGTRTIDRKAEWPDWRPPAEMRKRRPDLPAFMAGGPNNPLGARALYLGGTLYRIHGSNEPQTIGQAVSSGCIRMRNEDVTDLYDRVKLGTTVVVL